MVFRKKETLAAFIAAVVMIGYIVFLLIANYLSHAEVLKASIEQIKQDMEKRAAALSYFSSERVNDLKELAAGKELSFFFVNKALGMSLKYGLSANIYDIRNSFDRLLAEKKIGSDPIYSRIDFISSVDSMHISCKNPNDPPVSEQELLGFLDPGASEVKIIVHQSNQGSRMIFSKPYVFKEKYVGQIIAWVDINTIYRRLIQATEESSKRVLHIGHAQEYLPLPEGIHPVVNASDLPAPDDLSFAQAHRIRSSSMDENKRDLLAIKVPVENTPFFLLAIMPYSELSAQKAIWQVFAVLASVSIVVLAGIGFLLRIKDQNLILSIRLDESDKRHKAISQKNLELQKEIAEREEMEKALRSSEVKYHKLYESLQEGFVSARIDGKIIECNMAFREMLGYTEEEIRQLSYEAMTPEQWRSTERDIIKKQVLVRGYSNIYEKEFYRKNGSIFPAELRTYLLTDKNGRPTGTWAILRNISDRKQAEEELKRAKETAEAANRAKSAFLANMSHELRTPLHQVIGFTELVANRHFGELNSQQENYLHTALQSSHHLLSLINDILDIAKVEAGKLELSLTDVDLPTLLQNSLTMIKERAIKHRLKLSASSQNIPRTIKADERKLKQIIYNLLSNAAKFTPNGGAINLEACCASSSNGYLIASSGKKIPLPGNTANRYAKNTNFVEISVTDTGIGLSKDNIERIFNPFEQAQNAARRKIQGTGLGLTLSRDFVELHGGLIWAESKGEGQGSTFRFVIPILDEQELITNERPGDGR